MKKFFILILIIAAFALGVYAGRLPVADLLLGSRVVPVQASSDTQNAATEEQGTTAESSAAEKATVVSATQLSAGQRELLTKLGINVDALTITAAMVACAEAKLGAARLAEIQAGATPTFTEGASLLACYR